MNLKPVKSALGCRLRDPKTKAVLPNVADTDTASVIVDLDDPHWFRALQCGDLAVQSEAPSPAPIAPAPPPPAPVVAPPIVQPAAAAPLPPPSK